MMMAGGYGFGGLGILGMFFQIAMMLGFVFLIVYLFQSFSRSNDKKLSSGEKTSVQILEERYARGEIDDEEFKQKKIVLRAK
ncbi:SHOCT domain-containing protein [Anaerobacillus sp. CMMVII]|uniref:SHOCT domain-containing protein n=1 Tax=Anaerobacillus sp. CMMVII TaxID=2755588 RepID=UPI0021B81668|nr:SHOCT domain-containing protein [Anaerobacillus sp. CMMVII]MCT8139314.1 SHOCT domain-containing protein [Anaerobacillus sp. CMMVII]